MGHFGLAVADYVHSTAPNRRVRGSRHPKDAARSNLGAAVGPYTDDQLTEIASRCTERGEAARKVERTMRKVAGASMLAERVGESFAAIVTASSPKGIYRARAQSAGGRPNRARRARPRRWRYGSPPARGRRSNEGIHRLRPRNRRRVTKAGPQPSQKKRRRTGSAFASARCSTPRLPECPKAARMCGCSTARPKDASCAATSRFQSG